jgi:hypothetical protein
VCLPRKTMTSTRDYFARIDAATLALAESDHILIGAGAGLSAASGLNYQDPRIFRDAPTAAVTWITTCAGMITLWKNPIWRDMPITRNL